MSKFQKPKPVNEQRVLRELAHKDFDEKQGESIFYSLPKNDDGTRTLVFPSHSLRDLKELHEDLNDLMIPMNTRKA